VKLAFMPTPFSESLSAGIGEDGMSDIGRELKRNRELRDEAMRLIHDAVAQRTGIRAELIAHLPSEYLTLAVLLGVRMPE
jgi:hypothetical protein